MRVPYFRKLPNPRHDMSKPRPTVFMEVSKVRVHLAGFTLYSIKKKLELYISIAT